MGQCLSKSSNHRFTEDWAKYANFEKLCTVFDDPDANPGGENDDKKYRKSKIWIDVYNRLNVDVFYCKENKPESKQNEENDNWDPFGDNENEETKENEPLKPELIELKEPIFEAKRETLVKFKCNLTGDPTAKLGLNIYSLMKTERRPDPKECVKAENVCFHKRVNKELWEKDKTISLVLPLDGELMVMKFDHVNEAKKKIFLDNEIYLKKEYENDTLTVEIILDRKLYLNMGENDKEGEINMIIDIPNNVEMDNIKVNKIDRGSVDMYENKYMKWKFTEKFELEKLCLDFSVSGVNVNEYTEWYKNGVKIRLIHHYGKADVRCRFCAIKGCNDKNGLAEKYVHYVKPNDLYTFHFK